MSPWVTTRPRRFNSCKPENMEHLSRLQFSFLSPYRSEQDELIHVTFVYGEDRSATTDYITPLTPVDFHRHPPRVQIVLSITGLRPGHLIVGCNTSPAIDGNLTERDFLRINIARSTKLDRVISIVGWLYFAAWSCSFYPQIVLNLQRQR